MDIAEESSREVHKLMKLLPGRPLWGAQADAAAALVAMARGTPEVALEAARSAHNTVRAAERDEDPNLDIMLPVARVMLLSPDPEERQSIREFLRMTLALTAQRTIDEDVRVRWFRGPVGRELAELAGAPEEAAGDAVVPVEIQEAEPSGSSSTMTELSEGDSQLLWLLIEGRTNRDIAQVLGVSEEVVVRRLARMYGRIGVSSRGEATAAAFRERVV
jgi:DNA-binding NarL/FixJ family response regulator